MAAVKRKSPEGLSTSKPHKSKKSKDVASKETKTAERKKKKASKEGVEGKATKSLSIAFPEEGKVEWNTIKKQSKMLTEARKQKKLSNSYELIQEAKRKFEVFRNHKCQGEERAALVAECASMMKGLLSSKARSHDVARLIQWLLKLGSKQVRDVVVGEILDDVVNLAKCKYSSHIVKNVVVSCDAATRRKIIAKFTGSVMKLLSSKLSAPILEDVYAKYATSLEKATMRRELYGDLCKPLIPLNGESKLSDVLELNKALAPSILSGMKATLSKCLEKPWLLGCPIVLSVVFDYLNVCSGKDREEMIGPLRSHVTSVIKSKIGADVGLIVLKHSSAKEKKEIIKDLKGDIANIAVSPSGCVFLLHLIDSVDDTVLMKKALLPTVIDNADELVANDNGRKLLSYIVAHRDGHFFHPSDVKKLKTADESEFVKKSAETRMKELRDACVPTLLDKIADNPKLWLKDGCTALLTSSVLRAGDGDKLRAAHERLAAFVVDPSNRSQQNHPPVEDAAINKILKKLVKSESPQTPPFAQILSSHVDADVVELWTSTNRGCFALVFLLECRIPEVVDDIKSKISPKIAKKLKKSEFKGAEILSNLL